MNKAVSSLVIEQQMSHCSIRKYQDKPIGQELLETLIRAGQAAATSSFIQAYSVIRVTRLEARSAIAAAAGGQKWIEQAAEFLVFCADLRRVDDACRRNDAGKIEGWSEHGIASVVDVALMAQNVLVAAESVGLGGVFIGGIRNDPQTIIDELKLPNLVAPIFGMCLGWPAASSEVKPRMPVELILHQDSYRDPKPDEIADYDTTMAEYYRGRSSNTRTSDWSAVTAQAMQGKKREHMLAFLQEQGLFRR